MSETLFFFDTYAFFEFFYGNVNYRSYEGVSGITTIFNLAELNYGLKKVVDRRLADELTEKYNSCLVDVSFEDIKNAADLKIKYKDLSIPDCVGYVVAKRFNVKFLTGDQGFKDLPNVEFVKK